MPHTIHTPSNNYKIWMKIDDGFFLILGIPSGMDMIFFRREMWDFDWIFLLGGRGGAMPLYE